MTLPLTPDMLHAAYEFLKSTPPFSKWNLPDGEDVTFKVSKRSDSFGRHWIEGDRHVIEASSKLIGHTVTLIELMAHEMIHVHQNDVGMTTSGEHNAAFRKLAERVCKVHGFDPKSFA